MKKDIETFISLLKASPHNGQVFNPWYDMDGENDTGPESPEIRRQQLAAYLNERVGKSRYILMGEAVGYQGGHFSGIPMTSERILLGFQQDRGIKPADVFSLIEPKRTSREDVRLKGFSEPTATIVWDYLLKLGIPSREFVIWNTFPWHPYNPQKGLLSNRKPTDEEIKAGMKVLKAFLQLFKGSKVIAVGKVAEKELQSISVESVAVRHPANGGAGRFRKEISAIIRLSR